MSAGILGATSNVLNGATDTVGNLIKSPLDYPSFPTEEEKQRMVENQQSEGSDLEFRIKQEVHALSCAYGKLWMKQPTISDFQEIIWGNFHSAKPVESGEPGDPWHGLVGDPDLRKETDISGRARLYARVLTGLARNLKYIKDNQKIDPEEVKRLILRASQTSESRAATQAETVLENLSKSNKGRAGGTIIPPQATIPMSNKTHLPLQLPRRAGVTRTSTSYMYNHEPKETITTTRSAKPCAWKIDEVPDRKVGWEFDCKPSNEVSGIMNCVTRPVRGEAKHSLTPYDCVSQNITFDAGSQVTTAVAEDGMNRVIVQEVHPIKTTFRQETLEKSTKAPKMFPGLASLPRGTPPATAATRSAGSGSSEVSTTRGVGAMPPAVQTKQPQQQKQQPKKHPLVVAGNRSTDRNVETNIPLRAVRQATEQVTEQDLRDFQIQQRFEGNYIPIVRASTNPIDAPGSGTDGQSDPAFQAFTPDSFGAVPNHFFARGFDKFGADNLPVLHLPGREEYKVLQFLIAVLWQLNMEFPFIATHSFNALTDTIGTLRARILSYFTQAEFHPDATIRNQFRTFCNESLKRPQDMFHDFDDRLQETFLALLGDTLYGYVSRERDAPVVDMRFSKLSGLRYQPRPEKDPATNKYSGPTPWERQEKVEKALKALILLIGNLTGSVRNDKRQVIVPLVEDNIPISNIPLPTLVGVPGPSMDPKVRYALDIQVETDEALSHRVIPILEEQLLALLARLQVLSSYVLDMRNPIFKSALVDLLDVQTDVFLEPTSQARIVSYLKTYSGPADHIRKVDTQQWTHRLVPLAAEKVARLVDFESVQKPTQRATLNNRTYEFPSKNKTPNRLAIRAN